MAFWTPTPGETPIDDVSGLKIKGITTRAELSRAEAENIEAVVSKYLQSRPSRRSAKFTDTWCFKLHKEMFGRVWRWAGETRTENKNLGAPFQQIRIQMAELMENLACWQENDFPANEQAARLHHGAVHIHPFENGNGRWSRMLANIWLKLNRHPITRWPESTIGTASSIRDEYLAAIKMADDGEFDSLITLHDSFTEITA